MIRCVCSTIISYDCTGYYSFGFHQCKSCGRIFYYDSDGWKYAGKENIIKQEEIE